MSNNVTVGRRCAGVFSRGVAMLAAAALASGAAADTVTLRSVRDNTLIETSDGSLSNGAGDGVYSGRTGMSDDSLRRAVVAFDLAGEVPVGAIVTGATLTLTLLQSNASFETHTVHRLRSDWGEGTSSHSGGRGAPSAPGDATWLHTMFPKESWSAHGGDFTAEPSASVLVGYLAGPVNCGPTAAMTADVQAWVDDPSSGHGWIVIGNEQESGTAKKFASHEWPDSDLHPRLTIEFDAPCTGDIDGSGTVDFEDLLAVLAKWGPYEPCPPHAPADLDRNCTIDFADILVVLAGWGACP